MISSSQIIQLTARLGAPIITTRDEARYCCIRPECADTKYRMYVSPEKGKYYCMKCGWGGSLAYLFKRLGLDLVGDIPLSLWHDAMQRFIYGVDPRVASVATVVALKDYSPIFPASAASAYLISRGIGPKLIDYYALGVGYANLREIPKAEQSRYIGRGRIVFPDFDADDNLCYWVARTYVGHRMRYKNAQVPRTDQVYNLGRLIRHGFRKRIIICEGVISAIRAGIYGVCTYGKSVTSSQISRIVDFGAEDVVVALDADARLEACCLADALFQRRCAVRVVNFEHTVDDPASVSDFDRLVDEALPWAPMTRLRLLLGAA